MPRQPVLTYGDGWFAEERHESRPFRWMGPSARCRIEGLPSSGPALLRVTGGVWGNKVAPPTLSVTVNGQVAGRAVASEDVGFCVFPIESSGVLDVELALDRTFSVPGDERALGLMVRGIEVFAEEALEKPVDAEGWFEWEDYEYFPFRWMGLSARVVVPGRLRARGRFAQVPVCADCADGEQVLTLSDGDTVLAALPLLGGWHVYDIPLRDESSGEGVPAEPLWLSFRLNRLLPVGAHPTDPRKLGVRVGLLDVHDDRRRHEYVRRFHAAAAGGYPRDGERPDSVSAGRDHQGLPIEGDGWFWTEYDEQGAFRWMGKEGQLRITDAMRGGARYCVIPMFSSFRNLSQEVTVAVEITPAGGPTPPPRVIALLKAWNVYSLELPPAAGQDLLVTLRLNKIPPAASHPDDPRPLGIRVGAIAFHDDGRQHERQTFVYDNAVKNQHELQEGATVLSSFPKMLGIDLYGKCNIKPACVYCLWDPMKALEGEHVDTPIDDRTLESYGHFFRAATQLVNCSFGEPLLHPRFTQILEFIESNGKTAEISSNGQAFTPQSIRALEGKPIHLYVSLDSATPETYARLRNDRWHEIVTGLLFLRDARRRGRGWPRLNMVFMPMRANRQDVEMYFRLCKLAEADQMVLRPLLYLEDPGIERDRGGYHFDYQRELLAREELEAIFAECGRYARRYDVRVISQFDFGKIEATVIGEGSAHA